MILSSGIALANQALQLASVKLEMGFQKVCWRALTSFVMIYSRMVGLLSGTLGDNSSSSGKGDFLLFLRILA